MPWRASAGSTHICEGNEVMVGERARRDRQPGAQPSCLSDSWDFGRGGLGSPIPHTRLQGDPLEHVGIEGGSLGDGSVEYVDARVSAKAVDAI